MKDEAAMILAICGEEYIRDHQEEVAVVVILFNSKFCIPSSYPFVSFIFGSEHDIFMYQLMQDFLNQGYTHTALFALVSGFRDATVRC